MRLVSVVIVCARGSNTVSEENIYSVFRIRAILHRHEYYKFYASVREGRDTYAIMELLIS
jgi:hypothetical protein